jgi:uncharacterized protein (TIGR02145 family)
MVSFYTNGQFQQINNYLSYNDYINNPAEMFYDKGANVFINHRAFYGYRNLSSNGYTLPSLNAAGFKNVFQNSMKNNETKKQKFFPGIGVIGSYINGGGAFSEYNLHIQGGFRWSLDDENSIRTDNKNSYIALAGGVLLGNVFTRSLAAGNDFYLTHSGDPVLENFNASYGVSRFMKFGFTLRKHLTNAYQYVGLDMSAGIPFLVEKNSLNYATNYYFQINPEYQWGESSLISCAVRTIDASKSIQLVPYIEFELFNYKYYYSWNLFKENIKDHYESFIDGERDRKAFSIGLGAVLNAKSNISYSNFMNQIFINIRFDFLNYSRKIKGKPNFTNYGDVVIGPAISTNSLFNVGLPININASYSFKKSVNSCENTAVEILGEKSEKSNLSNEEAKVIIGKIDDLKKDKVCYSSISDQTFSDLEKYYNELKQVDKQNYEITKTCKINGLEWTSSNYSNTDNIPIATSLSDWKRYCDNKQPAGCYYGFKDNNKEFGVIYNAFALEDIAPSGYRLPTYEDYDELKTFLQQIEGESPICLILGNKDNCAKCSSCARINAKYKDFNYFPYGGLEVKKSGKDKWGKVNEDGYFWSIDENADLNDSKLAGVGLSKLQREHEFIVEYLNEMNDMELSMDGSRDKANEILPELKYYGAYVRLIKK